MNVASPSRPQQSSELFSTRTACIVAVVLAAGIFGIYSPALDFQFVLDDHRFVGDPRLQSPGHVLEYFTSYVWAQVPVPKRKPRRKSRKQIRNDSHTRFSAIWLIAAAAACLAAMMTKETAVVLPAILFAMALMMTLREANGARTVRARAAVFR